MGLAKRLDEKTELIRSIRLSPIPSIITDAKGVDHPIIAANGRFEQLTGYNEKELIGHNCRILTGPETDRAGSALLSRAIAAARPAVVVDL